jgi:hypothetical protein
MMLFWKGEAVMVVGESWEACFGTCRSRIHYKSGITVLLLVALSHAPGIASFEAGKVGGPATPAEDDIRYGGPGAGPQHSRV